MNTTDEPQVLLHGSDPIDRQIHEQIRACILAGALSAGEQLPTARGLAVELEVNPDAVQRAYDRLEGEGLVNSTDGSGVRVAWEPATPEYRHAALEQLCSEYLARAQCLGFTPNEAASAIAALTEGRFAS